MSDVRRVYPELGVSQPCMPPRNASRILCTPSAVCMNRFEDPIPDFRGPPESRRATICLWSDSLEEKVEFTTWLTNWKKKLAYVSHDYGCGCCVHLFDVEGPREAIEALPREVLACSAWTEHGIKQPSPATKRCPIGMGMPRF